MKSKRQSLLHMRCQGNLALSPAISKRVVCPSILLNLQAPSSEQIPGIGLLAAALHWYVEHATLQTSVGTESPVSRAASASGLLVGAGIWEAPKLSP